MLGRGLGAGSGKKVSCLILPDAKALVANLPIRDSVYSHVDRNGTWIGRRDMAQVKHPMPIVAGLFALLEKVRGPTAPTPPHPNQIRSLLHVLSSTKQTGSPCGKPRSSADGETSSNRIRKAWASSTGTQAAPCDIRACGDGARGPYTDTCSRFEPHQKEKAARRMRKMRKAAFGIDLLPFPPRRKMPQARGEVALACV